jgi:hypothetical protein
MIGLAETLEITSFMGYLLGGKFKMHKIISFLHTPSVS